MGKEKTSENNDATKESMSEQLKINFQNRSESIQEIISRKPGFLEKRALPLFLILLMALIGSTWLIRYPDIIEARGKLAAFNGPREIIPKQAGRLIKLFVQNDQHVNEGDMIGWIESTANTSDILNLSFKLDSCIKFLHSSNPEKVSGVAFEQKNQLGSIQSSYQTFIIALQKFNDYLVNGFYLRKKAKIISDLNTLKKIDSSLQKQKRLTEEDTTLSQNSFSSNEQLYIEKVISLDEYRTQKMKLLNKRMAIPQVNTILLTNESQQREKSNELDQLNHDFSQQTLLFQQALHTFKSVVDDWVLSYTIRAPFNGNVMFTQPLQQNQYLQQGKLIGYITPVDSKYYVEILLPQNNFGKVDTGMLVQLRFEAYPFEEVGYVSGKLDYISRIASDSGFLAIVRLDNGLLTNLNNSIPYKGGLKTNAIIITKNMRLLSRVYSSIIKATSKGK
jgi:multidrug resistance efflux pump